MTVPSLEIGGLMQVNLKPILTTRKLKPDNGLPVARKGTLASDPSGVEEENVTKLSNVV